MAKDFSVDEIIDHIAFRLTSLPSERRRKPYNSRPRIPPANQSPLRFIDIEPSEI